MLQFVNSPRRMVLSFGLNNSLMSCSGQGRKLRRDEHDATESGTSRVFGFISNLSQSIELRTRW